ncbi:MAG: lipase [Rhizobiaceae bacterium]
MPTKPPQSNLIKKRAVFFVGGFDPKSAQAFYERADRENERFARLWDVVVTRDDAVSIGPDITRATFHCRSRDESQDWETQTDFHFVSLDDIVLSDFNEPERTRFQRYLRTFSNFVMTGTAFKFFWHSWRFALYFFYPALALILCTFFSYWVSSSLLGFGWYLSGIVALVAGTALFVFLYNWLLKRYSVSHLMDLWSFSKEYLYRSRNDIEEKLDRVADQIFGAANSGEYDEILTIGHSTGGALMLDATSRVLDRHPEYKSLGHQVTILTLGSTALKVGLHPAANWFRSQLAIFFKQTDTAWIEFQCLTDVINFYKTDPAELMGFKDDMQRPIEIYKVRIKNMVSPEVYKRIKRNYFRVHYQFVFGNTVKNLYDYPAICYGPVRVQDRLNGGDSKTTPNPYLDDIAGITKAIP